MVGAAISLAGSGYITNGSATDSAAYIAGAEDGIVIGTSGSVENSGTIKGGTQYGIVIDGISHVINGSASDTNAYICGYRGGLWGFSTGYISNYGTIRATSQVALNLGDGINDTIVNGSTTDTTALIAGQMGGVVLESGTLTNFGTISTSALFVPSNYGAALLQSGLISNSGLIEGTGGVMVGASGTLINSGTIIGEAGSDNAVYFSSGFPGQSSRLIVDPGAEFIGTIKGRATVTMELASASSSGTISGLGTQIMDVETIAIDTGASWLIAGDSAGLAAAQTITGFAAGDTIKLDGFSATSDSYVSGTGMELGNGTNTVTLDITGNFTTADFTLVTTPDTTEIVVCYLRGTRILTPAGEVPAEELHIGDMVITRFSGMQRIKWIGGHSIAS